jgi:hypothetical protein
MKKYKFITDYLAQGYSKVPEGMMIPTRSLTWQFHKDDIFAGVLIKDWEFGLMVEFEIKGTWSDDDGNIIYEGIGIFKVPMKVLESLPEITPVCPKGQIPCPKNPKKCYDPTIDYLVDPCSDPIVLDPIVLDPPVDNPPKLPPKVVITPKKREFFLIRFFKRIFGIK